jgi:glycosyltransferase involved in cell wall biosynthesis
VISNNDQKDPLVSVIINTYNSASYLESAIGSVLASDYNNLELIVWDNQSTDSTRELVSAIQDERLKYIYAPRHTELGEARNLALEYAKGRYVGYCDADDMWGREKISLQVAHFNSHPNTVAVFSDAEVIDFHAAKTGVYSERAKLFSGQLTKQLLIKCSLVLSSCLLKTDILHSVGAFPKKYSYIEEYQCWLKMSLLGEIHVLPECLTIYREHAGQKSRDLMLRYVETSDMVASFRLENNWSSYDMVLSFSLIKAALQACRYCLKQKQEFKVPFKTFWKEFWKYPVGHVKLMALHLVKGF